MESISKRLTSRAAITLYIIMASSYIVNAMDRQVFANLVKSINQELGLTIAQGGLLSTIFAVGFGITGFFAGYMLDKWARKTVMIAGILVYSLFTIAIGISTGFIDMGTFRILTGVGEAMQQTALFTIAGVVFASRRNLAIGGLNAAYGMGAFLGPVIGVQLFTASNSWRFPFYVFGIIGIVFAVILWFVLPKDFTEFAKEASTTKKAPVASAPIAESGTSASSWISKNLILLAIANGLISFSNFGYNGLYPTFLKSALTFSASDAAFAHGFYGIGAFTGIISGYLADKYGEKKILLFALVGSMANAYLMFNVLTVPWHQAVSSFFMGAFGSGFLFVNIYALTQKVVPGNHVGKASGIASSAHYLTAGFAGGLLGTLVQAFGWSTGTLIQMVLLPIVTIICIVLVKIDPPNVAKDSSSLSS